MSGGALDAPEAELQEKESPKRPRLKVKRKSKKQNIGSKNGFRLNVVTAFQDVWRGLFLSRYPKAYTGDTYVYDLAKASNAGKPWMKLVLLGVVLTVLSDFALLSNVFSYLFDTGSGGLKDILLNYVVPISTIAGYLFIGFFAGKKLREYRVLRRKSALASFIFFMALELLILIMISVVRYYSELAIAGAGVQNAFSGGFGSVASGFSGGFGSGGFGSSKQGILGMLGLTFDADTLWCALMLSFVMCLGALLEMYHSYCTYEPFAAEKKSLAQAHIAEDKLLYEKVYFETALSPEKCAVYERMEEELDKRAVDSAFRISELATKLNGIVDPADAYDFCTISRLANHEFFAKAD